VIDYMDEDEAYDAALREQETRLARLEAADVAAACGRSECQNYATVFCDKMALCYGSAQPNCEAELIARVPAYKLTEETCENARETIESMTCTQFRALLEKVL